MSKKIVLTGGGTAGHVTPNLALLPELKKSGFEITYIGSKDGIEKRLAEESGLTYYGVSTGKLRRYFDLKNFSDPFRIVNGFFEAKRLLKKIRPDVVFSKGGFVSVPVVRAAAALNIPCIIHESDMTPGLANKLCIPVAKKVCCNFPETMQYLPEDKAVLTGTPIRAELLEGTMKNGLALCGFSEYKPVLMVMGGSQGAKSINAAIRSNLDDILKDFQILHLCGKGNLDPSLESVNGYKQFEYLNEELKDAFAVADIVVSRAGANAICELVTLKKPNVLIPLPTSGSRGDQLLNAASFEAQGFSYVLKEEDLNKETLLEAIHTVYCNRRSYLEAMGRSGQLQPILTILKLINDQLL
ncbi:MAG: undecaprenyldiphospho-muramoylpentapeptide beta-N-acetylglucosaminyltransferase [Lachnospiraceae bacterium]|nr:undecaprenyldiphospho-muramoylpentapeptide beta-N-acetylglucosaminyltransferase [Lachnospiraceae bacterium]